METLLFLTVVAFIVNHELDAIQQAEWRFFFPGMDDVRAFRLFVALHVPLLLAILWNLDTAWFRTTFSVLMVVHAGAHYLLRNHPAINFDTAFSRVWVYGAAVLGVAYIALFSFR